MEHGADRSGRRHRRHTVLRIAAAALAAALVVPLAGCGLPVVAPWGSRPAATGDAGVDWGSCEEYLYPSRFDTACGTVTVPRDWADPDGPTLDLVVSRVRVDGQADRLGSLIVNPGGPGVPGLGSALDLAESLPADVARRFDLIGFDPRGVGWSDGLFCLDDEEKDLAAAVSPAERITADSDAVYAAEALADACEAAVGADVLATLSTDQTARDLDAIRAAVGDEELTYLGYSYGSLLGAVYAHLFPGRIRAMVLDGAVDPLDDDSGETQIAAFEAAFDAYAGAYTADCGADCTLGPDLRLTVRALLTRLRIAPLPAADGRDVTDAHLLTAIAAALYDRAAWPELTRALERLADDDPEGVQALADSYHFRYDDGSYDNVLEANAAIGCADEPASRPRRMVADIAAEQPALQRRYPLFGGLLAQGYLTCALWPVDGGGVSVGPAVGAPPILVVSTTGDPATPYANGQRLADLLGTGTVLTVEGEGHTAYPGSRCVNEEVGAYLLTPDTPLTPTTCPS